ncbi:cc-nbs-lrr resistance protein [Corchorus olitorius]|uniref:Cc-nbs-lrr resistance protein n=1 Tax=Corchorus olitorius TaxID=93759 RepID=A0A1R3HU95_9ROSI|nr:cc-nbs-lrr resistance protein [Corchorus olitorius]
MARALISCVQEQLISFLQENEDVDSFLVQKAKQGLGLIVGGLEEKVQKLINNFEDIQAVLEDAERKQVKEASVRRWLKKLKDVDHDVEDLLEEWNTAKLRSKLEREERNAENEPLLKKMTSSGEDLQGRDLLEEITQYLLSDSQHTSASDEQSLMSRVNSLCCLLQKDPAGAPTFNIKEDDVDLMISSY